MRQERERIQENGISLILVTSGWNVGRCVDVSPVRQVEIPVPGSSHFAGKIQGRGQPDVGSWEEPTQLWCISPPGFWLQNVKWMQTKGSELGSQARKGKFIRGKGEGDWLLRRTSVFPFWWSPSYTPPMKNPLKGWSHSQRSGIWWSCSCEKIGTSEITGCHLGSLVSLIDHCDFILCFRGPHNEPSYQWDPMWALSNTRD